MSERLRVVPRMLGGAVTGRYPALSRGRLGLIALGLAYLVSPVDLLPEVFLPLIGFADDGVIALWLGGAFLAETERFLEWERQQPAVVDAPSRHEVDPIATSRILFGYRPLHTVCACRSLKCTSSKGCTPPLSTRNCSSP
jgi:uncharacterized membrane protein YkvA (DUF1232 family)